MSVCCVGGGPSAGKFLRIRSRSTRAAARRLRLSRRLPPLLFRALRLLLDDDELEPSELDELADEPPLDPPLRLLLSLDWDEESSLPPPSPPLRPDLLDFSGVVLADFDLDFDRLLWAMLWVIELLLALESPDPSVSQSDLDSLSDEWRDNSSDSESLPKTLRELADILRS